MPPVAVVFPPVVVEVLPVVVLPSVAAEFPPVVVLPPVAVVCPLGDVVFPVVVTFVGVVLPPFGVKTTPKEGNTTPTKV